MGLLDDGGNRCSPSCQPASATVARNDEVRHGLLSRSHAPLVYPSRARVRLPRDDPDARIRRLRRREFHAKWWQEAERRGQAQRQEALEAGWWCVRSSLCMRALGGGNGYVHQKNPTWSHHRGAEDAVAQRPPRTRRQAPSEPRPQTQALDHRPPDWQARLRPVQDRGGTCALPPGGTHRV